MSESPQKSALKAYRDRLGARGLVRFEVLGRPGDRALVRALARRLAADGPDAASLRALVQQGRGEPPATGGILAALRRSPMVGADLDLTRPDLPGRATEL